MIEARGLVKRYGGTAAVDDLSFTIHPGQVTGFLGPNGAGKTTTMRLILGLDHPSAGTVTVNGRPYAQLASPMHVVGALLDAGAVHGGRTARSHLLCLAQTNGIARRRVDEVLSLTGLTSVAGGAPRDSRSACASGSALPPRCSATRRSSCSTSRSTGLTPRASGGSAP